MESRGIEAVPLIWNLPDALSMGWDAIVVRSVWDYHKQVGIFLKWIADAERSSIKLINDSKVIRWNIDKSYLLQLSRTGTSCVPSLLVRQRSSIPEALNQIKKSSWSDIVVKPTISATAFLTFRSSASDPKLPKIIEQVQEQSDVLIQPYLSSVASDGEVSLVFFNGQKRAYSHSVLKRPRRDDFRVQSDFGGTETPFTSSPELIKFADSILGKISGEWAFARVDIVDWKRSPLLSEVELIEPDLFFSIHAGASDRLAEVMLEKLSR